MRYLHIFFIFIQFSTIVRTEVGQNDWVDPFDMSSGQPIEYIAHNDLFIPSEPVIIKPDCKSEESRSNSYLKRIINMILNSVHEDHYDEYTFRGHLMFEIDSMKYRKLKDFTDGKFEDLNEIDTVLSEILRKPAYDYLDEFFLPLCHRILNYVTSRSGIFTICILSYVIVIYQMMKGHFSYWSILKFLFINAVVIDFVFVWIRLYQKAEIDKLADTVKYKDAPTYCDPSKMTTLQVIWNALSTVDRCKEFYQVTLTDIFWNVSPGDVIVEMFTRTITQPIKTIGPAIGDMILKIYSTLPFGTGFILLPITLVFILVMTCITFSFVLNTPIKFNFFHLISFSFGERTGIVDRSRSIRDYEPSIENRRYNERLQDRSGNRKAIKESDLLENERNFNQRGDETHKNDACENESDPDKNFDRNRSIPNEEPNTIETFNGQSKDFLERITEVLNESSIMNVTEGGDTDNKNDKPDDSMEIRKRKRDDGGGDM